MSSPVWLDTKSIGGGPYILYSPSYSKSNECTRSIQEVDAIMAVAEVWSYLSLFIAAKLASDRWSDQ